MRMIICCLFLLMLSHGVGVHEASAFKRTAVGELAQDFSLETLDGKSFRLSENLGEKATLILFWATWNSRSLEALADFQRIFEAHGSSGLQTVAVNTDGEGDSQERISAVASVLEAAGVSYPSLVDVNLSAYEAYGVVAMPSMVLIDSGGQVLKVLGGYANTTRLEFQERVVNAVTPSSDGGQQSKHLPVAYTPKGSAGQYYRMGQMYFTMGKSKQALKYLVKALHEDPEYTKVCGTLSQVLKEIEEEELSNKEIAGLRSSCNLRSIN